MKKTLLKIAFLFLCNLIFSQNYGFSFDKSGKWFTKVVSTSGGSSGTSRREATIPYQQLPLLIRDGRINQCQLF